MALSLTAVTATTSATGTAVTGTVPTGVVAGSIIIVGVYSGSATITGFGSSGLQHAPGSPLHSVTGGGNANINILWKRSTGTEPGSYALTMSSSDFWVSGACRVEGAATGGSIWDTNSGTGTAVNNTDLGSANSLTTSMTTQADNELLFNAAGEFNGGTWTQPTSFTKDFTDTAAPGIFYFAHLLSGAAGATGTLTTSVSGAAAQMADWLGAIIPSNLHVNSASIASVGGTTSATVTIPGGTGIAAGDLIVVCAGSQVGHTTNGISVSDAVNGVNYPTILETDLGGASTRWMQTFAYTTPVAIPDGTVLTCNGYATATNTEFSVDIFRGIESVASRAAVGSSNPTGTTSAAPALASAPPTFDLVLTFCMAGSGTLTPAAPFVAGSSGSSGASTAIAYALSDGVSTFGSTWTLGTSNTSAAQTVSFRSSTFADPIGYQSTSWHPGRGPNTRARFFKTPRSTDGFVAATINGTATIVGAGVVTDVPSAQVVPATLTGAGVLTANGSAAIFGTATLAGAGALTNVVTQLAPASVAGAGSITNVVTERVIATLSGAGAITANSAQQAAAGLSGLGAMSAFVTEIAPATIVGAGSLTATAGGNQSGSCSLAGAGALSALATVIAPATITGVGALTALVVERAPVTIAGTGSTTALVTEIAGTSLTGSGALTASAAGTQSGSCSPAGAGSLSVVATVIAPVTITGAGAISPKATMGSFCAPTGAGVVANILVRQLATNAMVGAGVLTASPAGLKIGVANLVGAGVLTTALQPCVIFRLYTGTTAYNTASTARPGTGTTTYATATTARPDTGVTEDPC